jgi:hypothetical protein
VVAPEAVDAAVAESTATAASPSTGPRASSAPRGATHPSDKKKVVPKVAPSSSERPFMPAEL